MAEVSWKPPTLSTDRLLLRALEPDDAGDVYRYASNPEVARFTLWEPHASAEESLEFITGYARANYSQMVPDPFAITLKGQGRVVGTVGCFWVSREHRCMELGYALDEEMWGRGITTEAARALVDYVFEHFEVERVQGRCKRENAGSARIMDKLGMLYEGTLRSAVLHQGRSWDIEYRAVLRADCG